MNNLSPPLVKIPKANSNANISEVMKENEISSQDKISSGTI